MKSRLLVFFALVFASAARANDGALDWSGSPRLMSGHPSVEMKSEIVRLVIAGDTVRADCRFVFVNHGAACRVRVGFPDDSAERWGGGYDDAEIPPSGVEQFRSFVDGREVPTRLMRGPDAGGVHTLWRVKTVAFAARGRRGSTRHLRETYTTTIGGAMGMRARMASYTLHTGSSWRGPIGRSEIIVSFPRRQGPLRAVAFQGDEPPAAIVEGRSPTIAYQGPGQAIVSGKTLRWVRTNWRPTVKDDIQLFFPDVG